MYLKKSESPNISEKTRAQSFQKENGHWSPLTFRSKYYSSNLSLNSFKTLLEKTQKRFLNIHLQKIKKIHLPTWALFAMFSFKFQQQKDFRSKKKE